MPSFRNKGSLQLLSMLAAMSVINIDDDRRIRTNVKSMDINDTIDPPIPKGCKENWFNENGGFRTDKMLRSEIVFKCITSCEQ